MNLIKRLFKKTHDEPDAPVSSPLKSEEMITDPPASDWQEVSSYQPAPALVSLIAAALGAECYPESQFVIRRIEKRNPEFKRVALIAASIAAGELPDSQFTIKKIAKKNENK